MDDLTRKFYEENEGNPEALAKAYGVDLVDPDETVEAAKDAAQFAWESLPGIGTAYTVDDIKSEFEKEEPDYLKIGLLAGTEVIGLVPGLGSAAKSMIRKGADMARQTDNVVDVASNVPKVAKEPFKKTRPAYRIATQSEDGKLYPLFVNADDEIPVGTWIDAKMPPIMFKGANGNMYVPSKGAKRAKGEKQKATGDLQVIPDEETAKALKDAGFQVEKPSKTAPFGKVRSVAARPGYHATTKPVAHHLGPEDLVVSEEEVQTLLKAGITPKAFKHKTFRKLDGKTINKNAYKKLSPEDKARVEETKKYYVKRRAEDQVFVEVDMADDTSEELAAYMKERNRTDINDKLPVGGSYSYVDGQADGETWVVGGNMRVNRVLSREEAKAAQEAAGVQDLPYRDEVEAILGRKFSEGGLAGEDMYGGQDDMLLASTGDSGMNEQMDAVFKSSRAGYAEGGEVGAAPDTTIGVDPVSGNEVPMGATPEEVRDDIPAQLSEGEYVVPADVVRFYGVKFFEDLRTEAKQGYAEMDQNGRIGGEPVGPEGMEMIEPEDDLPFDISELQMIDDEVEMAEGGYLERAMNREKPINRFESLLQFLFKDKDEYGETPIDRYKEQMGDDDMGFFESFMGNPIERGERKYGKKGYAEGGDTAPLVTNPFSPTGATGGFEIKEYVNDAGEVMYIQFMNGQPMTFIPQGFRPKASASEQAATGAGVAASSAPASGSAAGTATTGSDYSDRLDSMDVPEPKGKTARESWTDASIEDITKNAANLGYSNSIISTGLGAISGPLGVAAGIGMGNASRNKAYDMLDGIAYQIEALNENPDQNATKIKQLVDQQKVIQQYLEPSSKSASPATSLLEKSGVFGGATSLYQNLGDYGGSVDTDIDGDEVVVGDGRVTFGDTWLGDLLGFDGKAGVQGPGLSESLDGARRTAPDWEDEGDAEKAAARKAAASKAKEEKPSGSGKGAAYDAMMAKGIGASDAEQDRLNRIAAQSRAAASPQQVKAKLRQGMKLSAAEQEAVNNANNAGLGWMYRE
jgi:hypothetical protein